VPEVKKAAVYNSRKKIFHIADKSYHIVEIRKKGGGGAGPIEGRGVDRARRRGGDAAGEGPVRAVREKKSESDAAPSRKKDATG